MPIKGMNGSVCECGFVGGIVGWCKMVGGAFVFDQVLRAGLMSWRGPSWA